MCLSLKIVNQDNLFIYNNLIQMYEAEFSKITNKKPNKNGLFELDTDLGNNIFAYLFYVDDLPAGFVVVKSIEIFKFEICEYFILPIYRNKNYGKRFAFKIWNLHPGKWIIKQIAGAEYATSFWRRVIGEFTNNDYQEELFHDDYWGKVTMQTFKNIKLTES